MASSPPAAATPAAAPSTKPIDTLIEIEHFSPETPIDLATVHDSHFGKSDEAGLKLNPLLDQRAIADPHPALADVERPIIENPEERAFPIERATAHARKFLSWIWKKLSLDKIAEIPGCKPIIAGGIVEHIINNGLHCCHPDVPDFQALTEVYSSADWKRDIDVFICYQADASGKVISALHEVLHSAWFSNISEMLVMSDAAMTLKMEMPTLGFGMSQHAAFPNLDSIDHDIDDIPKSFRMIQFVPSLGATPESIINNFDLDACSTYFDGTHLFALPRAVEAWRTRTNVFRPSRVAISFEKRVLKYNRLGYDMVFPEKYGFDPSKINFELPLYGGGIISIIDAPRHHIPHAPEQACTCLHCKRNIVGATKLCSLRKDSGKIVETSLDAIVDRIKIDVSDAATIDADVGGAETFIGKPDDYVAINGVIPTRWNVATAVQGFWKMRHGQKVMYRILPSRSTIARLHGISGEDASSIFESFLDGHFTTNYVKAVLSEHYLHKTLNGIQEIIARLKHLGFSDRASGLTNCLDDAYAMIAKECAFAETVRFTSLDNLIINSIALTSTRNWRRTPRQSEDFFCCGPTPTIVAASSAAASSAAASSAAAASSDEYDD